LLVVAAAAHAQPGVDASALVADVASYARSAVSWVAEGQRTVIRPGQPAQSTRFELWYSQTEPFKARINFGAPVLTLSRICDGAAQWIWYPGTKSYGGTESPQIGVCAYPLNEWPALGVSLHAAVVAGTDRVTVNGGERPCTVVHGEYGGDSRLTLCIDTERKLILRYAIENAAQTEAFTFHVLKRDEPIDAEILQFHAPLDAQPPIPGAVVAPVVVARTSPRYSDEALQARYEGRVVLSLTITADGFADDIKVTSSPGMGLDEKAIECVKAWKWRPGMKGGQPAAVPVTVEVNFRLIDTKR